MEGVGGRGLSGGPCHRGAWGSGGQGTRARGACRGLRLKRHTRSIEPADPALPSLPSPEARAPQGAGLQAARGYGGRERSLRPPI